LEYDGEPPKRSKKVVVKYPTFELVIGFWGSIISSQTSVDVVLMGFAERVFD